ncbi:flagellar basal body-associated FliL family protein [Rhodobacteraceae bacterium KMM 6894]|nr:flagellar basal body-associated FliL family protein [Rhodobacteraceae bacterium KMM 6894]
MADTDPTDDKSPRKASKVPLIIGLMLAVIGGGGGFYATYSGVLLMAESHAVVDEAHGDEAGAHIGEMPDVAYVAVEPLVISVGNGATGKHLRFRAHLEVTPGHQGEVESLMPRIVDVLNSYLRALELSDLTDSTALVRLRSQMLRRIQIVTGGERVNDLLIMEFVLN